MLNTHTYDGKWKEEMDKILELDGAIEFDYEDLIGEISDINPDIHTYLLLIKDFDKINDIDAKELLARTWRKATELDEFDFLFEQIQDISKGSCAQGQTTRLFQVLSAFYT